jgi:hypothetical protein
MTTSRDSPTGHAPRRRVRGSIWLALAASLVGGATLGGVLAYPQLTSVSDDALVSPPPLPQPDSILVRSSAAKAIPSVATAAVHKKRIERVRPHADIPSAFDGSSLVPCSRWRPLQIGTGSVRDLCQPGSVSPQQSSLLRLKSLPSTSVVEPGQPS